MMKRIALALALTLLPAAAGHAQEAPVQAAAAALGATGLRTIEFSGWGSDFVFGQGYDGASPWPRFILPAYSVAIDFAAPAIRDDRRRTQAENPPRGGGFQPLIGEQRQIWLMRDGVAWDMAGQNAVPAALERDLRSPVDGRMAQIWLTPHGFVMAALAGNATTREMDVRGETKTIVTVTTPTDVTLEGVLDEQHLVERIETRLSHPVVGDMVYEAEFGEYQQFGPVRFPTRIVHRSGGYPVLDVTITDVRANAPVSIEVPANIRQAGAPAPATPAAQRLADGVWYVPGGASSTAIEFSDYLVVIEAPESEERSLAVIEAIRKVVPAKPIRYVVNTHSHFDHVSGLRTYAAEGATIVTHRDNIPFYEEAFARPRTIRPDRLAQSGRQARFEGVVGSRTFTDGARRLVLYHYPGNMHNPGMLMAYLPKEKILVEADSYTPPADPAAAPGGLANLVHFHQALERLRLDVEQIVPIHGRLATMDDLRRAVATFGRTQQFWEP